MPPVQPQQPMPPQGQQGIAPGTPGVAPNYGNYPNHQNSAANGQNPNQPQASQQPTKPKDPSTTQNTLIFSEIRDNLIVMNDGSFRAIVACESINFDLMSSREREGIEYSYQDFLNSLYFPVQVLIRSQRVDIGPYIDKLIAIRRGQDNMLLNVLMDDYINFIDILSQEANIMDKSFYITIPYYPNGDTEAIKQQAKGFFSTIFGGGNQQQGVTKINKQTYEKARDELKNRIDLVISGLAAIGVRSMPLNTKEIGKLYYNFYNPDTAIREPLSDFDKMATTFVMKGKGEAERPHLGEGF